MKTSLSDHIASAMNAAAAEIPAANEIVSTSVTLPETELDRHLRAHRNAVEKYGYRAMEAMKRCKEDLEDIRTQRKQLIAEHKAALAKLAERADQTRVRCTQESETADRLAQASRAALRELEK